MVTKQYALNLFHGCCPSLITMLSRGRRILLKVTTTIALQQAYAAEDHTKWVRLVITSQNLLLLYGLPCCLCCCRCTLCRRCRPLSGSASRSLPAASHIADRSRCCACYTASNQPWMR